MKKNEIKVGGLYRAKVSNVVVTVRVDEIRVVLKHNHSWGAAAGDKTVYDVTNLSTGRKTTFRSAAKFRSQVNLSVA